MTKIYWIMNNIIENNAEQRKFWLSKFGENYINRNKSMDELNQFYEQQTFELPL